MRKVETLNRIRYHSPVTSDAGRRRATRKKGNHMFSLVLVLVGPLSLDLLVLSLILLVGPLSLP